MDFSKVIDFLKSISWTQLSSKLDWTKLDFTNNLSSKQIKLLIATGITIPVAYYILETCHFIWRVKYQIGSVVNTLPGPPTRMLTGNLHQHPGPNEKGLNWFIEMALKYKSMTRFWMGPLLPVVILFHPEPIKDLLKTAEPKIMTANSGYNLILPWLGYGLLTSHGPLWARNRRLLTPGFHFDVLKPYVDVYNEDANKLVDNLLQMQDKDHVEIFQAVSLCTLQTVLRCAFSYEQDVQSIGENHPYVAAVTGIAKEILYRTFRPWLRPDFIYYLTPHGRKFNQLCNYVHRVADEIIAARKTTLKSNPDALQKKYLDFLDILLSARDSDGKGLTDLEIRQEVDTFLFEGHDTTASAISWTLYSLAENVDIQEKARQEVRNVLPHINDDNFEWEDLNKLPYLTQCIKEGMRLHSPVPGISRELSKPVTIGDVTFPKYTLLTISIYTLHHNPHVWGEDHMVFKPERFELENIRKKDPHAFTPFSAGPRNCIGQNFAMGEMKVIIGKILNRFSLNTDPDHVPIKLPELVMRAKNGIKLRLTPLQDFGH